MRAAFFSVCLVVNLNLMAFWYWKDEMGWFVLAFASAVWCGFRTFQRVR